MLIIYKIQKRQATSSIIYVSSFVRGHPGAVDGQRQEGRQVQGGGGPGSLVYGSGTCEPALLLQTSEQLTGLPQKLQTTRPGNRGWAQEGEEYLLQRGQL